MIKTWKERIRPEYHDIKSMVAQYMQDEIDELRERLVQQVDMVEKCMTAMNENADRGEKAEAERDALQAELDRLKQQEPIATVESWTNASYSRNYKLDWHKNAEKGAMLYPAAGAQPELEALRADAERYRWMRDKAFTSDWNVCAYKSAEYVDAYIDAARTVS